jgi:excisionase family DNA binding protein
VSEREQGQAEKLLYTVGDAAALLNVSRAHVYNYVIAGDLRSVTLGRARRIPLSAIAEFVERLEGEGHLASRRRRVPPRSGGRPDPTSTNCGDSSAEDAGDGGVDS